VHSARPTLRPDTPNSGPDQQIHLHPSRGKTHTSSRHDRAHGSYGLSAIVRRADTQALAAHTINLPFFYLLIALGLVNGLVLAAARTTRPVGVGVLLGTVSFAGLLAVLLFRLAETLNSDTGSSAAIHLRKPYKSLRLGAHRAAIAATPRGRTPRRTPHEQPGHRRRRLLRSWLHRALARQHPGDTRSPG